MISSALSHLHHHHPKTTPLLHLLRHTHTSTYTHLLNQLAQTASAPEAEQTLLHLSRIHSTSPQTHPFPTTDQFNVVLKAWIRSQKPSRAEQILKFMTKQDNLEPDVVSFNTVMSGYAKQKSTEDVERVWTWMMDEKSEAVKPDAASWNVRMKVYDSVEKVEELMREMVREGVEPDAISYQTLLKRLVQHDQLEEAESYLTKIPEEESNVNLTASHWNIVIGGYCKANRFDDAQRVLDQLRNHPDVVTDTDSYNILIDALSKCNHPERAESILNQMESDNKSSSSVLPNSFSYNSIISSYSHQTKAMEAERILHRMETQSQTNSAVLPDTISYNIVLGSWSKWKEPRQALRHAERLFHGMEHGDRESIRPDLISYTTLLHCYSRIRDSHSLQNIIELYHRMEQQSDDPMNETVQMDIQAYNVFLNALASTTQTTRSMQRQNDIKAFVQRIFQTLSRKRIPMDIITLNTALNIFAKCGDGQLAHQLLSHNNNDVVTPDIVSYNCVLNALGKENKLEEAQTLLEQMVEKYKTRKTNVKPDVQSFNTVMNAWSQKGEVQNARHILELLRTFHSQYPCPNTKPNKVTYSSLIHALSKTNNPDVTSISNAIRILQFMETEAKNGKIELRPDTICYNSVLHTIARSRDAQKAQKAYSVLRRMSRNHVKCDNVTYNSVLNACAFSSHQQAFSIAWNVYQQLVTNRNVVLDSVTYGTMMNVCNKHLREYGKRIKIVKQVFQQCCQSGYVNQMVLKELRYGLREDDWKKVLGQFEKDGMVGVRDLPRDWTRNVK